MPENLDNSFSEAFKAAQVAEPTETNTPAEQAGAGTPNLETQKSNSATVTPSRSEPSINSSLMERARSAGIELDGVSTEADLAQRALDRYLAELPYAQHGRASLVQKPVDEPRGSDQKQNNQNGDADANKSFDYEGHFKNLWNVPEMDDQAKFLVSKGIVEVGEDGLYQAKPGYEAIALPVLNGLNQSYIARREMLEGFLHGNPYKATFDAHKPAIEYLIEQKLAERMSQQFSQRDESAFVDQFLEQNKHWIYDANGGRTPEAEKFAQAVEDLRASGINDPRKLADYAIRLAGISTTKPDQGQQVAAPVQNGEKPRAPDGKFVKQPVATPPKTKQESFIDRARKQASANSSHAGTSVAEQTKVANQGDLDGMFEAAWRQAAAV